jgi:Xaa-Pro aminopeptidase
MKERIAKLRARFEKLGVDAFLSNRLSNIRYLCGYSGSNGLLFVTQEASYFLTDFRYQEQIKEEVVGVDEKIIIKKDFPTEFKDNTKLHFKGKVGIEAVFLTVDQFIKFKEVLPEVTFINTENVVEEIASVKDPSEMAKIREAVRITDMVFADLLKLIRPGVAENDLAAEVVFRHMKYGATGNSFDTIIASGYRGALPHGEASSKKIENGDLVTIDMGCVYQGYCSDLTRTVVVGEPTTKQREIYDLVFKAQSTAITQCKAEISGTALDAVARNIIKSAGYGDQFGHGLGHGIGLEVHAHPRVSFVVDHQLHTNQVVTIEPGIYISGWGGVRIEDDVIVKENGCEVLNKAPKELIII